MASMDISLEVSLSNEASGEVQISVDFGYVAGSPAHMGSLTYAGHPADPPEIDIQEIYWPIKRWDAEKQEHVDDHIVMPHWGLPDSVLEAIEAHICQRYDPGED